MGDSTVKSRLLPDVITELQFVDDAALYATSVEKFISVTQSFVDVTSTWGLTISLQKTKVIGVNAEPGCGDGKRVSVPWELNRMMVKYIVM